MDKPLAPKSCELVGSHLQDLKLAFSIAGKFWREAAGAVQDIADE